MEILKTIFYVLIFPGLLISAFMGMLLSGCDSYITAIIDKSKPPKILQYFIGFTKSYDLKTVRSLKYLKIMQLTLPIIKLVTLIFVIMCIPIFNFSPLGFGYDLIIVIYLLGVPKLYLLLRDAFRANNKLDENIKKKALEFIAYELPFVIIILTLVVFIGLANGNRDFMYSLRSIAEYQIQKGSLLFRYELIPAALSFMLLMHMKAGKREFEFSIEKRLGEKDRNTSDFLYCIIKNLNYNLNSYIIAALFFVLFLGGTTVKVTVVNFLIFFLMTLVIGIVGITLIRGLINKYDRNKLLTYYKFIPSILAVMSLVLVLIGI